MQPRRKLSEDEFKIIVDYPPPKQAIRFSKKQLLDMGFSKDKVQEGGLVRISGKVYSFVGKENNTAKSFILGEGLYGRVKLLQNVKDAEDKKALKVLFANGKPPIFSIAEDYQQFVNELNISIALNRASEEVIKKVGEGNHVSFCGVLDVIPGVPLAEYLKDNKNNTDFTVENRLKILLSCLKEVQWLHHHNVTHGDIHTGNFMYDAKANTLKIIDFGRAELISLSAVANERETQFRSDLAQVAQLINSYTWKDIREKSELTETEKGKINDLKSWVKMEDMDTETVMTVAIMQLETLVSEIGARQKKSLTQDSEFKNDTNPFSASEDLSLSDSEASGSPSSKHFIKRNTSQSLSLQKETPASTKAQDALFVHVRKMK